MREQSDRPDRGHAGPRDVVAALFLASFFVAWHADGVFGGRAYYAEDAAAYFVANRTVHHVGWSDAGFDFWDPLPGLGQPRLANIQNGSFSPLTIAFHLVPAATMFRFYPALVLSLLSVACYALLRARRLDVAPAMFGALAFSTTNIVLAHVQQPPVIETILWLPATLLAWQLAMRTGNRRWVALTGVGVALQCFGGSPQYLLYGLLVTGVFIASDLLDVARDRTALGQRFRWAAAAGVIGLGIGSWQLLPFLEMAELSHRTLLHDPARFVDAYRAAVSEVWLALSAEQFFFIEPPRMAHAVAAYVNAPNLSLLVVVLAAVSLTARPAPWVLAVGAGLFMLGMLGSAGGVTPLLAALLPSDAAVRAPYRMLVPAAFLLSTLAATGLQHWLEGERRFGSAVAWVAVAWIAGSSWWLKQPDEQYVDPAAYAVPAGFEALPGRMAVDFLGARETPLFAVNAGLAAGVPTLLQREVLIPANFFEGYFASQYGSLRQYERLDRAIVSAALPLEDADAPLLRAYGLRSVVRFEDGRVRVRPFDARDRFRLVPRGLFHLDPEALWRAAADPDWNPDEEVLLSHAVDLVRDPSAGAASIEVLQDDPSVQRFVVDSGGGFAVTSGLFHPGWRVAVDGREAEPVQVDFALRAVVVPPGRHTVDWRYRPTWLGWAWAATGAAFMAAAWLAIEERRARRGAATSPTT